MGLRIKRWCCGLDSIARFFGARWRLLCCRRRCGLHLCIDMQIGECALRGEQRGQRHACWGVCRLKGRQAGLQRAVQPGGDLHWRIRQHGGAGLVSACRNLQVGHDHCVTTAVKPIAPGHVGGGKNGARSDAS